MTCSTDLIETIQIFHKLTVSLACHILGMTYESHIYESSLFPYNIIISGHLIDGYILCMNKLNIVINWLGIILLQSS